MVNNIVPFVPLHHHLLTAIQKGSLLCILLCFIQWLADVNQKVMLENGGSVPVILLANKVSHKTWLVISKKKTP